MEIVYDCVEMVMLYDCFSVSINHFLLFIFYILPSLKGEDVGRVGIWTL